MTSDQDIISELSTKVDTLQRELIELQGAEDRLEEYKRLFEPCMDAAILAGWLSRGGEIEIDDSRRFIFEESIRIAERIIGHKDYSSDSYMEIAESISERVLVEVYGGRRRS